MGPKVVREPFEHLWANLTFYCILVRKHMKLHQKMHILVPDTAWGKRQEVGSLIHTVTLTVAHLQ